MEDPKLKELQEDLGMTDEEFSEFMKNSPAEKEGSDTQSADDINKSEEEGQEDSGSIDDEMVDLQLNSEDSQKEYKSQMDRRKEKMEAQMKERMAQKAEKSLKKRREALKRAANKFRRKREKIRNQALSPTAIKNYDSAVEVHDITDVEKPGNPLKITPDVEKLLFPYFVSGASIRSIAQQFGRKYDFALQTLYAARDFYKWERSMLCLAGTANNI